MNPHDDLPFGHALCPECDTQFDMHDGVLLFTGLHSDGAQLLFYTCPNCASTLDTDAPSRKKAAARWLDKSQKAPPLAYSITTMLALKFNGYDPALALEWGLHDLFEEGPMSRELFDSFDTREVCIPAGHALP